MGARLTSVAFPPVRELDETWFFAVFATAEAASADSIADACEIANRSAAAAGYPVAAARLLPQLRSYAGQITTTIRNPLLLPAVWL